MDLTVESTSCNLSANGATSVSRNLTASWTWKAVFTGRVIFIACLVCVAAVMGSVAWYFLDDAETRMAENQFEAIADRAIHSAREIVVRKRLGTISLASVVAHAFPLEESWPFVALPGYGEISSNLINTSSGREMALCPIVTQSQLSAFEAHAYRWYQEGRSPPFPNGTGYSSFGPGIWMPDKTCNCSDNRTHVTSASSSWGSKFEVVTPLLQHNQGSHPALMLNLHFEPTRGTIIDNIITCSGCTMDSESGEMDCSQAPEHTNPSQCGALTDMLILTSQTVEPGPGALLMEPIYPVQNSSQLVGVISSSIVWDESLRNVFSNDVNGVDCVLYTDNQTYTYGVSDGVPHLRGEGDLHERSHDEFKQEIILTPPEIFSGKSAIYTLAVYPTDEFFDIYRTSNPRVAAIGAVCIIIFTTVLFFFYDFCVRKEFDARKDLLEAKRQFVRFISHEVRTPLNTVCMGLSLMQEEIARAMGLERPEMHEQMQLQDFEDRMISGHQAFEWMTLSHEALVNAKASVDVLNDLLNYDKVQQGNLHLELSVFSIWTMLESTVAEFKLAALERKVFLKLDFSALADAGGQEQAAESADTLPPQTRTMRVVGDAVRLSQVIRNLVSNGLKFTPEQGHLNVRVRIEPPEDKDVVEEKQFKKKNGTLVTLYREGNVCVDVIDTGVGMTEDQVAKVFVDGTQFNVNQLQGGKGSGLGMYIAKGICKRHGGTLECWSGGLGHGTTFTMTMPLYRLPESLVQENYGVPEDAQNASNDIEAESLPLRILVVDDSASNLKLLTRLLVNRGHECDGACNGQEALNMVLDDVDLYDTILLDYEMPVMDGPTACAEMRKIGCSAFIVGVTGNIMLEDVEHFRSCGANAVLPKPFKLSLLENLWSEYGVVSARKEFPAIDTVNEEGIDLDDEPQQMKDANEMDDFVESAAVAVLSDGTHPCSVVQPNS